MLYWPAYTFTYTSDCSVYIESLIDSRAIHLNGTIPYKKGNVIRLNFKTHKTGYKYYKEH